MSQNKVSGAAANKWGLQTARRIAPKIGAAVLNSNSNEVRFKGKRVVIKCVKAATNSVRVTFKVKANARYWNSQNSI